CSLQDRPRRRLPQPADPRDRPRRRNGARYRGGPGPLTPPGERPQAGIAAGAGRDGSAPPPVPPRRTEIAAAVARACAASSGIRRGVTRNPGPQMWTAAMTAPRASWTGAAAAVIAPSQSPRAVAMPPPLAP